MNYSTRYMWLIISIRWNDMYKGYYKVRVKECDIHETTFRTHYGLLEFCDLPFGLYNAPARFQAMMNRVLAPYLGKFCVVSRDDVLIYNKTADEHLEHTRLVLQELQRHRLHIKLSKCCDLSCVRTIERQLRDMWWKLDISEWTPTKWRQYKISHGRNL
jgi:hypothetical protein